MQPDEAMPPATIEEWRRWRRDIFGDPYLVWHDGPDFSRLLPAARDDPGMVRRMLVAGIEDRDTVAAESVAVLAEAGLEPRGASHLLRAAAPNASGGKPPTSCAPSRSPESSGGAATLRPTPKDPLPERSWC